MFNRNDFLKTNIAVLLLFSVYLYAQMENLHGDFSNHASGVFAGNQFRTTFYNDGTLGMKNSPPDIGGEWPINSGHLYMYDGDIFLGSEVLDIYGSVRHIFSSGTGPGDGSPGSWSSGDMGPTGEWWTFLPLPGFNNPSENRVAMSKWPQSWPVFWPDKYDDITDPGWPGYWNGYFGKGVMNADEEGYFVADDYQNREFNFFPDSTDNLRRGLGMRMYVRGLQWSAAKLENVLFMLYDFENIGTYDHDKMVLGFKVGNNMGDTNTGGDGGDDMGGYNAEEDLVYLYDYDDIGAGGWTPVGYFGIALLETPDNANDGIDNDGDGEAGSGRILTEDIFEPKTLNAGDQVVLIDYETYERTVIPLPADGVKIRYRDIVINKKPGDIVEEIPHNKIDDDLNGLIDENNGSLIGTGDNQYMIYLNTGLKYIDYITGEGLDNLLLDEKRDDGIDNDGDWDVLMDDVGGDGVAMTGDMGEGDGLPTTGEPHFETTDIDESDHLGLTSFNLYLWPEIPLYDDEMVWNNLTPGFFNDLLQYLNIEMFFGSGYFGLKPDQHQRLSLAIMCAVNSDELYTQTFEASTAYNNNYRIEQRPAIPTLKATPGDNQVLLQWDDWTETQIDPVTGMDFEGYRIYRSTSPDFSDISPIAQFDLVNEYSGYSPIEVNGEKFYLGDNTGIVHEYVDDSVVNGYNYYYAVTSYDHGAPSLGIPPSECRIMIDVSQGIMGRNVVTCMPRDPSTSGQGTARHIEGTATGVVNLMVVDKKQIKDGHAYRITFKDTLADDGVNRTTKSFTLFDLTNAVNLLDNMPLWDPFTALPCAYVADGFQFDFDAPTEFSVNEQESGWNNPGIYDYEFQIFRYSRTQGYPEPADYQIEFSELGVDTSVELAISTTRILPSVPVNFKIKNLITNSYIHFGFYELDIGPEGEGVFSAFTDRTRSDEIIFVDDSLHVTWQFRLTFDFSDEGLSIPHAGDIVKLVLHKPFTSADIFEMVMPDDFSRVESPKDNVPRTLSLLQNYPNPFNPSTAIPFCLPEPAHVKIEIYNTLGQKIRTFSDQNHDPGTYRIVWDGKNDAGEKVAAGVYFYRLQADAEKGKNTLNGKMLYLR
ncbi:gliding motility-associated C-terminal domain-containing protein [candidate division KSB1 bacterium]|nr:gliding motility-associated C-terminal domain-containing protein [candidate division KSB1 bacterium]